MTNFNFNELSYDQLTKHVEESVKALSLRAYAEGYKQGKFDVEVPKCGQQLRDEIVERAKRDIESLKIRGYYSIGVSKNPYRCRAEFIVNKQKRTVVVILKGHVSKVVRAKGIAKCDPSDCFNVHIGKAIALRRALGFEVPTEYLKAPQPTEVRVGDIVKTYLDTGEYHRTFQVSGYWAGDKNRLTDCENFGGYTSFEPNLGDKVIDDSREEVAE